MKAAILEKYASDGRELVIKDVPVPEVGDNEVLVNIKAAGVNPLDNMIVRGEVKLIVPYKFPLIMGNEFAGVVEKAGGKVTEFKKGDRVYARMPLDKIGAFAEYASVKADALAKIPDYLSFEEAASVPLTALTAWQAYALMNVQKGGKLFISGGTGSVGAMAIPIAKSLGLTVITNGSGDNEERVRALGADQFIDYRKENYADIISGVDYVLDTLGDKELENEFKILKDGGSLVSLRGLPNGEFARRMRMPLYKRAAFMIAGKKYDKLAAKRGQRYHFIFVHEDGEGLKKISEIFSDKMVQTSVDEIFSLDDINKAMKKVASGRSKGKTIIKI
ncbi:MAG: NADP-dependent oxidoreductase [Clostridia bacterium]|nr:NADP-dependent oxidoreductase [Clostridia bacterium]